MEPPHKWLNEMIFESERFIWTIEYDSVTPDWDHWNIGLLSSVHICIVESSKPLSNILIAAEGLFA